MALVVLVVAAAAVHAVVVVVVVVVENIVVESKIQMFVVEWVFVGINHVFEQIVGLLKVDSDMDGIVSGGRPSAFNHEIHRFGGDKTILVHSKVVPTVFNRNTRIQASQEFSTLTTILGTVSAAAIATAGVFVVVGVGVGVGATAGVGAGAGGGGGKAKTTTASPNTHLVLDPSLSLSSSLLLFVVFFCFLVVLFSSVDHCECGVLSTFPGEAIFLDRIPYE